MKDFKKYIKLIFGVFVSLSVVMIFVYRFMKRNNNSTVQVIEEYEEIPEYIPEEVIEKSIVKKKKEVSDSKSNLLTTRQKKILKIFKGDKSVDMDQISSKISGVHVRTLRRDLNKLVDLKFIKKSGTTKGSSYKKI